MTPLADVILKILISESAYPPLSVESLCRVLRVTGCAPEPTIPEIEIALAMLMGAGEIEAVWRRGAKHFRVLPRPAAVAARATMNPIRDVS